jgi:iron complex outermembrane receptor protein
MFATSIYTAPPPFGCDVNCPAPTGNRPDAVNNIFSLPTTSDVRGHSLTFTANINDYLTFKNITAYRTLHFQTPGFTLDAGGNYSDGSATTGYAVPFRFWNSSEGNDEQFSNETQLILDTDPLTLTTGILYYQMDQTTGGYANASSTIANSGGLISGSNGYYFINVVLPNDNHADAISSAAYAQAEWHFSDQWDLILGTRYTQDRKEFAYFDNALGYMHSTYEGNRPTYMIGLNYSPTDDIMVYAKYSTGYVSGGTTGYRSLTSTPAQFDYDPELSYSQEVGVKADWFDHALRTNLSIFQTDYSGFHIALGGTTLASNGFPQFANAQVVVLNGGDAHSWGGELETTWMTTDHLTLSAGIAYLDFDLTNVNPIYLTVGANVNPLQSQWSGNFAAEYESDPLFGDVRLQARLDASYRSEYYASNSTFGGLAADAVTVDPSWMANARAALTGFRIAGSDAEIALWGRNIFDSDHVTYSTRTSFTATQAMYSGGFDRAPTYGVDLTFDF